VDVNPADAEILKIPVLLEDALGPLDVDAEFRLFLAGCRLRVRLGAGVDVRVHPDRADRLLADARRDAVNVFDLFFPIRG